MSWIMAGLELRKRVWEEAKGEHWSGKSEGT